LAAWAPKIRRGLPGAVLRSAYFEGDGDGECDGLGDGDGVGLATVLARALLEVVRPPVVIGEGPTLAK
jgi:hypothetical protein